MELLKKQLTVSSVKAVVLVKPGQGKPTHKNRPTHGLAYFEGKGSVFRFSTGEVLKCQHGDLIYLPQGTDYTVETRQDDSDLAPCASVGTYAVNFTLFETETGKPFIHHVKGKNEMLSLLSRAVIVWKKKKTGYREECFSLLYQVIRLLRKEAEAYAPLSRTVAMLAPALAYIEESYTHEIISAEKLASLVGVSQPYLRKLFEAAFSVPPSVYIRGIRLRRAKELLETGEYSVTDAASLSGFSDISYFSRAFKKETGLSPMDFLKSIK